MRKVEIFYYNGVGNALSQWYKVRNPLRVALNFLIIYSCRYLPSLSLKNFLYKLIGIKVGKNVSVGLGAIFDIFFPELIEIGDNSVIGYSVSILAHEFLVKEWRKGNVKIGKNVVIGAKSLVMPGITIGDNSVVSAMSLVNKDVEENSFVGGIPIRKVEASESP